MALETRQRLYIDKPLDHALTVTLGRAHSHYLTTVLRMRAGEELLLFNGQDGEWSASITEADKKATELIIKSQTKDQDESPSLILAFAPIKKARIDFIAEKATELGAGFLQPIITERTQVSRINLSRLRSNAVEAAEQTGRTSLMQINAAVPLVQFLESIPPSRHLIFCDEAAQQGQSIAKKILERDVADSDTAILIGPEGGFSSKERALISAHPQATSVSLGGNVLRADTALLAATAIWQALAGSWSHS